MEYKKMPDEYYKLEYLKPFETVKTFGPYGLYNKSISGTIRKLPIFDGATIGDFPRLFGLEPDCRIEQNLCVLLRQEAHQAVMFFDFGLKLNVINPFLVNVKAINLSIGSKDCKYYIDRCFDYKCRLKDGSEYTTNITPIISVFKEDGEFAEEEKDKIENFTKEMSKYYWLIKKGRCREYNHEE